MSRRFFRGQVVWRTNPSGVGPPRAPHVQLEMRFATGNGLSNPLTCQWDSGAELSMMPLALAEALGVDLTEAERTTFTGTSSDEAAEAYLITRWVQFPGLCGFQFKLTFLVADLPDELPLLGLLDTYQNFDVHSTAGTYFFYLADRHQGEALPPHDCECDPP